MSNSVIAETKRLIIRPFGDADLSPLADMLADAEVMRFSVNGVMSREASQRFMIGCQSLYLEKGYGSWALQDRVSSKFIGFAGLTPEVRGGVEEVDVGYRLAQKYWGQGFATEATRRVLDFGFNRANLASISCTVIPKHSASLRVAKKVGFSSFELTESHGHDVRIYRMSLSQWIRHNGE